MQITLYRPRAENFLGAIPDFLRADDERPAAEQFAERYAFGGGWSPMAGWKTEQREGKLEQVLDIRYPGDEPLRPFALIEFRDEKIWIYESAWVAIEQPDGSVSISRMD
jgi:hypothetical protein